VTARLLAAVLFGPVITAGIAAAQAPMPPPPPPPPPIGTSYTCNGRPDPTGNSTLRGTILSLDTGAPVRDAQVQLGGAGLCNARTATDAYGRYELANLPAGRIYLSVAKAGYVTTSYGQRRPFEAQRSIELLPAQTAYNIDVALPRAGVIVARVTDEFGEPMSGVRVQAERLQFNDGHRQLLREVHLDALTDDRGELRLYGLAAGEYYVNAVGNNPAPIPLPIGAIDRDRVYLPTYFPGTSDAAGAQRVVVQAGREQSVTFPLTVGRLARVSGIVVDPAGLLPNAQVMASQLGSGITFSRRATAQPNGAFSLPDVLPGSYLLAAVRRASGSGEIGEVAAVPLTISGDDVSGVELVLHRTGTLRGRFVYDTPPPPGFSPGSLRFSFSPVSSSEITVPMNVFSPTSNWQPDSTFAFAGLTNRMRPRLSPTGGWFLKAVRVGGRDVTDVPFDFTNGADVNDVEVVVTQKSSQIGGTVQDDRGPASDYAALVFPENRELWVWPSRFIATARADQQGRFKIAGLPPGQYVIAAVDYLEQGSEYDPDLLLRLKEKGTPVVLGEGESKEISLMLTAR
jgi:hypothetical protein